MNITYNRPWSEIGFEATGQDIYTAIHEAGLNFTVSVRPAFFKNRMGQKNAKGYNLIIRDDIGEPLGMCKDGYTPVQNHVLIDVVDKLSGVGSLDTIGNFDNGAKSWILLKLSNSRQLITSSDAIEQYLLLVNGHDAKTSLQMGVIPFRLSCANMLPRIGKYMIKLKHTSGVRSKVKLIKSRLTSLIKESETFTTNMRKLVNKKCEAPDIYFERVLGGKSIQRRVTTLYKDGRGQKEVSGTWYAAFNAVTEYLNYESGRNQDNRLQSLWFGRNDKVNNKAYKLAMEMSTN